MDASARRGVPALAFTSRLEPPDDLGSDDLFDARFCPFEGYGELLAVAGSRHVIVARLPLAANAGTTGTGTCPDRTPGASTISTSDPNPFATNAAAAAVAGRPGPGSLAGAYSPSAAAARRSDGISAGHGNPGGPVAGSPGHSAAVSGHCTGDVTSQPVACRAENAPAPATVTGKGRAATGTIPFATTPIGAAAAAEPAPLLDILWHWHDRDAIPPAPGAPPAESLNSLCWARARNGDPVVCVAGRGANVKVLCLRTGALLRTLAGHGRAVSDLAASPARAHIVASASEDLTVRVWDLAVEPPRQSCAAILAQGHERGVLALDWHPSGLYLLSGGQDAAVCLWVMPSVRIWPDRRHAGGPGPAAATATATATAAAAVAAAAAPAAPLLRGGPDNPEPLVISHPHFRTTQLHTDVVDGLAWYGASLIFSRAAEAGNNRIVLWRVLGFEPHLDAVYTPTRPPAPAPPHHYALDVRPPGTRPGSRNRARPDDDETRSAFAARGQPKLEQLLTLQLSDADYYYVRFGVCARAAAPMLAFANARGKVAFWDLDRLVPRDERDDDAMFDCDIDDDFLDDDPILGPGAGLEPTTSDTCDCDSEDASRGLRDASRDPRDISHDSRDASDRLSTRDASRESSAARLRRQTTGPGRASTRASLLRGARHESEGAGSTRSGSATPLHGSRSGSSSAANKSKAAPKPAAKAAAAAAAAAPFAPIPPHATFQITRPVRFNARAVAWSREGGGRWCVVVGDSGMLSVFES